MEALLGALEASQAASYLRGARWGYAAVNALHILGIALLVGAVVPLNLRLLGVWRSTARADLVQVLAPTAAVGLLLSGAAGVLLFSVRAGAYAELTVFQIKLVLILFGSLSAVWAHLRHGRLLESVPRGQLRAHAAVSMLCWLSALICGRLIAFTL